MQPLLEVTDLRVSFPSASPQEAPVQAVRGVSFSLNKGEVLGIVGESGSGKSVSTAAIPGLLPLHAQTSGSVRFDGQELLHQPVSVLRRYRGRRIGMIFQEPGRSYDPLQNISAVFYETFRCSEPCITRAESDSRAAALLAETGLAGAAERLYSFPHQFSGGQLQRISIALALAQNCGLLIADEPTTALDVTIQAQIIALLKRLRETRGIAILFISHDMDAVAAVADRIMVMYAGLVMETGSRSHILSHARHPYTQALLDAAPRFGSHYALSRLRSIPGRVCDPRWPPSGCPFAERCPRAIPECRTELPALLAPQGVCAEGLCRCIMQTKRSQEEQNSER